jgi:dihydropyrimidine dehydrogenase (NAD+) subunit PreT
VLSKDGHVTGIEFDVTEVDRDGNISKTGKSYQLQADVIFKAIGQTLPVDQLGASAGSLAIENGRLAVNDHRKTSLDNVWAGGDCVSGGEDLTVCAVQDGKLAALSIHDYLQNS